MLGSISEEISRYHETGGLAPVVVRLERRVSDAYKSNQEVKEEDVLYVGSSIVSLRVIS